MAVFAAAAVGSGRAVEDAVLAAGGRAEAAGAGAPAGSADALDRIGLQADVLEFFVPPRPSAPHELVVGHVAPAAPAGEEDLGFGPYLGAGRLSVVAARLP